jgi:cytochrome c oxidase subunit III
MKTTYTEPQLPDNIQPKGVHPQRFALWIGMASLTMLFAALTSAYIVRHEAGNWVEFEIPRPFFISAIVLFISSLTIWWTVKSFKDANLTNYRLALSLTFTLSLAFCASQYIGWLSLQDIGIYIEGNPSGSFLYVISFIHVIHIAVGMLLLLGTFLRSFLVFNNYNNWVNWHKDSNKSIRIELLATYWHFVDFLWLYLLAFFYYF